MNQVFDTLTVTFLFVFLIPLRSGTSIDPLMGVRYFLMHQARKGKESPDSLPSDVSRPISDFCYNEIRSLFNVFTSDKDRNLIIGFNSYEEMHKALPLDKDKVRYLSLLRTDGFGSDETRKTTKRPIFVFNDRGTSIQQIRLSVPVKGDYRNGRAVFPQGINWEVFSGLVGLEVLVLSTRPELMVDAQSEGEKTADSFRLKISMGDLGHLPPSLRQLSINGHWWIGDGLNLEELPSNLEVFLACWCKGMDGTLNLSAPESNLQRVGFVRNQFATITGWKCIPPNLGYLDISTYAGRKSKIPEEDFEAMRRFRDVFPRNVLIDSA